jgi:hypothetical protein
MILQNVDELLLAPCQFVLSDRVKVDIDNVDP